MSFSNSEKWQFSSFHLPYSTPRFKKLTFTKKLLLFFHKARKNSASSAGIMLTRSLPDAALHPFKINTWNYISSDSFKQFLKQIKSFRQLGFTNYLRIQFHSLSP